MISSKPLKERAATLKTSTNLEPKEAQLRGGASEVNPNRNPNQSPTPNHRNGIHAAGKANIHGTNAQQRKPCAIAAIEKVISGCNAFWRACSSHARGSTNSHARKMSPQSTTTVPFYCFSGWRTWTSSSCPNRCSSSPIRQWLHDQGRKEQHAGHMAGGRRKQ